MADLPKVATPPQKNIQPRLCQGQDVFSHTCYTELVLKLFHISAKDCKIFSPKKETSFRTVIVQNASQIIVLDWQATPGQDRNIKLTLS
jgi:hypothetical protein